MSDADEVVEVPYPVIFQCRICRSIIADSTSFSSSNVNERTITFNRVAHLKQEDTIHTKNGNSYQILSCTQCDSVLGRLYIGTVRNLDHIRDLFTLDADTLMNYQIGTQLPDDDVIPTDKKTQIDISKNVIDQYRNDMDEVQKYLLLVDERLSDIEKKLKR